MLSAWHVSGLRLGPFQKRQMEEARAWSCCEGEEKSQALLSGSSKLCRGGEAGSVHKYYSGRISHFPHGSKACVPISSLVPITKKKKLLENQFVACV